MASSLRSEWCDLLHCAWQAVFIWFGVAPLLQPAALHELYVLVILLRWSGILHTLGLHFFQDIGLDDGFMLIV